MINEAGPDYSIDLAAAEDSTSPVWLPPDLSPESAKRERAFALALAKNRQSLLALTAQAPHPLDEKALEDGGDPDSMESVLSSFLDETHREAHTRKEGDKRFNIKIGHFLVGSSLPSTGNQVTLIRTDTLAAEDTISGSSFRAYRGYPDHIKALLDRHGK